jgi:hypothetical protein
MNNLKSKINRLRTRAGMTLGDGILLCSVIFFALLSFALMPRWMLSGGKVLEIRVGAKIVGRYSLDDHRLIKVRGRLGTTSVLIENGRARIQSSPCPHKICCRMGTIGSEGGVLVCVPNEVIVTVTGEPAEDLDAVSR